MIAVACAHVNHRGHELAQSDDKQLVAALAQENYNRPRHSRCSDVSYELKRLSKQLHLIFTNRPAKPTSPRRLPLLVFVDRQLLALGTAR
jgi:hypothetical protein